MGGKVKNQLILHEKQPSDAQPANITIAPLSGYCAHNGNLDKNVTTVAWVEAENETVSRSQIPVNDALLMELLHG